MRSDNPGYSFYSCETASATFQDAYVDGTRNEGFHTYYCALPHHFWRIKELNSYEVCRALRHRSNRCPPEVTPRQTGPGRVGNSLLLPIYFPVIPNARLCPFLLATFALSFPPCWMSFTDSQRRDVRVGVS
jgi:hypothetical protein